MLIHTAAPARNQAKDNRRQPRAAELAGGGIAETRAQAAQRSRGRTAQATPLTWRRRMTYGQESIILMASAALTRVAKVNGCWRSLVMRQCTRKAETSNADAAGLSNQWKQREGAAEDGSGRSF